MPSHRTPTSPLCALSVKNAALSVLYTLMKTLYVLPFAVSRLALPSLSISKRSVQRTGVSSVFIISLFRISCFSSSYLDAAPSADSSIKLRIVPTLGDSCPLVISSNISLVRSSDTNSASQSNTHSAFTLASYWQPPKTHF